MKLITGDTTVAIEVKRGDTLIIFPAGADPRGLHASVKVGESGKLEIEGTPVIIGKITGPGLEALVSSG